MCTVNCRPTASNYQLSHLSPCGDRTPASEVGGESVTTLPPWPLSIRTSHSPPGLYNDRKGSEGHGPLQRTQTSPIPGRLVDQVPVSGRSPSEHSGSGRPNPVLGVEKNQEKSELKPTQVFSFVGYEYHLDSALVKPTQERWLKLQDLILRLNSKRVLTTRCLMSLLGLLASTEKMVPGGRLHMRPFSFTTRSTGDALSHWTATFLGQKPFQHTYSGGRIAQM